MLLCGAAISTLSLTLSHAHSHVGVNMCVYVLACFGTPIVLVGVEQVIGSGSHEQRDVWQPGEVGKCVEM